MQPHLTKFLENNDIPPEGVLQEVKGLISKPLQEFKNKDEEIDGLNKTLNDLKAECQAIQESMRGYSIIISPIRRIPSDILHVIFYHCLPTHRNPVMSVTEAPLLLTRVCQTWRSIALSSHRIWSKIHISLLHYSTDGYSPVPYSPGAGMNGVGDGQRQAEKFARTMRARCHLADVWLSRSGSCPLSISLSYFTGVDRIVDDDANPLVQLFNTIVSFSRRFGDIELSMPYEIYEVLQKRIGSLDMVPRLRKLRINFIRRTTLYGSDGKRSLILLHAPNLRSVSLYTHSFVAFDSKSIPTTWENLTNLSVNSDISSAEAVQALRRSQNLEHCKLVISDGQDVYIGPEEVLSLPRIRSLSIHVGGTDSMTVFYRRLDTPLLTSFDYQKHHRFPFSAPGINEQATLSSSPILPLLEKCNRLEKLSFDPRILSAQDMLFSLRLANQLTHLILGQRPREGVQYDNGYYLGPGSFSLDLLIVEEDSSTDAAVWGREILLPKLEVFEAYLGTNFRDESLQRFILSRLGDPARKEVSTLKTVKVNFERSKDMNIEEEVYRRAEEVGVKIELCLTYFSPVFSDSKYADVFSPWYGLAESDRSWNFADIGSTDFF
ncbi:hypothetical protein GALMADRAFT_238778 [Galerina marginata CBS 339.88]|uniref:F-box domain-containing protein n=1 Tax=Galerina marginata (strain CBS 339.88) TaxID=685588 RepID=A0A067TIJ0_GALM3|nr:hypothetical protein GALMADRAFT_238778 [Galerina marginata CBS 339.88]